MSERVERRVIELIDGPLVSPYGNPVPGLADLGVDREVAKNRDEVPVSEVFFDGPSTGVVTRIGETPQAESDFLADLAQMGVLPGNTITVAKASRGVEVAGPEGVLIITEDDARHLFIRLD